MTHGFRLSTAKITRLAVIALAAAVIAACAATQPGQGAATLAQVTGFEHQVTGITLSEDGRIFVNFPRWTEDNTVSVGELKDGQVVPYPDAEWHAWRMTQ